MKRSFIKDVWTTKKSESSEVLVCGWVRSKRVSKNCSFLSLNDGSSQENLQIILANELFSEELIKTIHTGASVEVLGALVASPAQEQALELHATRLTLVGEASATDYPLQKKGHTLEFLREIAHLRPRTNTFGAVFRVRNALAAATHEFFQARNFMWAHTPIITASDAEGAGAMFAVSTLNPQSPAKTKEGKVDYSKDFFGRQAFLTVSGQLEAEFLALSLGNVYTFGPTFRAENSNTARHLAEFWMIEPEMSFCDLAGDMDVAEAFTKYLLHAVIKRCPSELEFFAKQYKSTDIAGLEKIANASFERVSYTEAIGILQKATRSFEFPVHWGADLATEHERYLSEQVFGRPVIVFDFPKDIKAFYMKLNEDGKTVAAMDLLVPGIGELIGGSQREDDYGKLCKRMESMNIPLEHLQWYLDLRRYGSVPHAGFGMGFERMVMFATGMQNIRDVIMCPRAPGLIDF